MGWGPSPSDRGAVDRLVVVAPAPNRASHRPENLEHDADNDQNDANIPQDGQLVGQEGKSPSSVQAQRRRVMDTLRAMSENFRIKHGWIYVNGTRQDDGSIELGTGGEMRFSPFEAISERGAAQITWDHILKASVQRLAFWRR